MSAQGSMNTITGAVTGGILAAVKISEGLDKEAEKANKAEEPKAAQKPSGSSGIDAKMAAKARKQMQEKINAIYANKELSAKARTRRVGVAMDEYQKMLGGKD